MWEKYLDKLVHTILMMGNMLSNFVRNFNKQSSVWKN